MPKIPQIIYNKCGSAIIIYIIDLFYILTPTQHRVVLEFMYEFNLLEFTFCPLLYPIKYFLYYFLSNIYWIYLIEFKT